MHPCKQQISCFTYSFVHHGALFVDLLSLPDEQIRTCILSEFNYLKFTLNITCLFQTRVEISLSINYVSHTLTPQTKPMKLRHSKA